MYQKLPNLTIAFHGCKKAVYKRVVQDGKMLNASENSYDWLGHGIYFWEQNLKRAEEWGRRRYGSDAAVVGAVIDLGYCLNLTDSESADLLKQGYRLLVDRCNKVGIDIPYNRPSDKTKDILLRDLDCAVIQQIQDVYHFDSVRGVFIEGDAPYPDAEFREKTHIQLCICNPNCIKGLFAPRAIDSKYELP